VSAAILENAGAMPNRVPRLLAVADGQ
jgi:hypothetical protein